MLFRDLLDIKTKQLEPEFDKLFENILKSQTHDGDLLLTRINGFYYPEANNWDKDLIKSPYMIGPNTEGYSDFLHYQFIDNYRKTSISNLSYSEYLKKHEWAEEKEKEINDLTEIESMSIQLEMLIYLKIWEADLFIKRLYQLTTLSQGEPYDWHFKITESNRNDKETTGKRDEIIRIKIRDRLKKNYISIYSSIKNSYRTQVRNSIGHSKYSFQGRHISLNNYIKDDKYSQTKVLSFNDWIDMFHDTMVIYNQLIRFANMIDNLYATAAQKNNHLFQIRINRRDPIEKIEYCLLKYRPEFKDWHPSE